MVDFDIGDVLLMHCYECTPPKPKFFVIVADYPDPILLFINSELNEYVQRNAHLHACHVKVVQAEHNFLTHDSWINCCEVCLDFSYEDIERELKYGAKHCGSLSSTAFHMVIDGVEASPLLKRKIKKTVLASLRSF